MQEQILALRAKGWSYNRITAELGCSKGTVAYHCGKGQKAKAQRRQQHYRRNDVLLKKCDNFKNRPAKRQHVPEAKTTDSQRLHNKRRDFQRKRVNGNRYGKRGSYTLTAATVREKYGETTTCYLTGRPIDLSQPKTYHFDHIVPRADGGSCEADNLGIACSAANKAKADMSVDAFLQLCKEVLEHHGYVVDEKVR